MNTQFVRLALSLDDGTLAIMSFITIGRGPVLPRGGVWLSERQGLWTREPTPRNLQDEVDKAFPGIAKNGQVLPKVVSWRLMEESEVPTDRTYRDASVDNGGKIQHDMPKARELHRTLLRAQRSIEFLRLDGEWMRAQGQKNLVEAEAVEAKRQKWRDAPADPRIEAAQTVEDLKTIGV